MQKNRSFNFNYSYFERVEEAITSHSYFKKDSINLRAKGEGDVLYLSWNRIRTCLDRIPSTLEHINNIDLEFNNREGNSFGFIDFLNSMYVVIDCIKALCQIFQVDFKDIEESKNHFSKADFSFIDMDIEIKPELISDREFFTYYRSLAGVHVTNTSSIPSFFTKGTFHSSMYVLHKGALDNRTVMNVLCSDNTQFSLRVPLNSFKKYLISWIKLFPKIELAAKTHNEEYINRLINEHINTIDEFHGNWNPYLDNLEKQYKKRYEQFTIGMEYENFFSNFVKKVLVTEFEDNEIQSLLERYQVFIKIEIIQFHGKIQKMQYDESEYIIHQSPRSFERYQHDDFHYQFQKLEYICDKLSEVNEDYIETEKISITKGILSDMFSQNISFQEIRLYLPIIDSEFTYNNSEWGRIQAIIIHHFLLKPNNENINFEVNDWKLYIQILLIFYRRSGYYHKE